MDEGCLESNTEYVAISAKYLETESSVIPVTKLISITELHGSKTGEALY